MADQPIIAYAPIKRIIKQETSDEQEGNSIEEENWTLQLLEDSVVMADLVPIIAYPPIQRNIKLEIPDEAQEENNNIEEENLTLRLPRDSVVMSVPPLIAYHPIQRTIKQEILDEHPEVINYEEENLKLQVPQKSVTSTGSTRTLIDLPVDNDSQGDSQRAEELDSDEEEEVTVSPDHLRTLLEAASSLEMDVGEFDKEENTKVLISDPEFGYISSAMESTETSPRMISVQMPSPDVEPDELPNEIMKDFENLDEHNESINETEDFILQLSEDDEIEPTLLSASAPSTDGLKKQPAYSLRTNILNKRTLYGTSTPKQEGATDSDENAAEPIDDESSDSFEDSDNTNESSSRDEKPRPSTKSKAVKKSSSASQLKKKGPKVQPALPKCHQCRKTFKNKDSLRTHLAITCGKEFTFSCSLCAYRGNRKFNLQKHLKGVHGVEPSEFATFGAGPKVQPPKKFKCLKCSCSYKAESSLKAHLRHDCGVGPSLKCTLCEFKTKRKTNLKRHLDNVHEVQGEV